MAKKQAKFPIGVLLVAVGLGLAVWVSWPLPRLITSAIPYTFSAKPEERVAGLVQGDHLQYLYHLNLLREATDRRISPFSNPYEFAGPYHWDVPYVYFPFALIYAPFSYVSPALGYNVVVLLSFVGTMVAGYGLARAWGANRGGSVCAGIVLTLFPHRLNSLFGGHAAGSAFFLFPMAWWGLEKNWQTGRKAWGLMAGLSLAVMSIQDVHHLFFFCLLLPFWAIWKLWEENGVKFPETTRTERIRFASLITWQGMTATGLLAACYHFHQVRMRVVPLVSPVFLGLLIFFFLAVVGAVWLGSLILRWLGMKEGRLRRRWLSWPWLAFWLMGGYFAADYVDRPGFGSQVMQASLLLFAFLHLAFLVRAIQRKQLDVGRIHIPLKRVVKLWPSAVGLLVALIYPLYLKLVVFARSGVAGGRTLFEARLYSIPLQKLFVRSAEGGTYVGWALVGFILIALVAVATSARHRPEPDERRRFWISLVLMALGMILACGVLLGSAFPLYNVLYRVIPFLSYIRSMAKYLVLTAAGSAVSLALILTFLGRFPQAGVMGNWLAPVVAAILILDWGLISRVGVSVLPRQSPLYDRVKSEGKGTLLLEVPIWPGDSGFSSPYQYGTMLTGVPSVNGYSPMVPAGYKENIADPFYSVNFGVLRLREFDLLKSLNVRFINFHEELFPRQVSSLPATHSLKRLLLNPNLELVTEEGGAHLFRLAGETYQDVSGTSCDEGPSVSYYVPYDILNHQVGEEKDDAESVTGKAWYSDGRKGFLFYGPFLMLPPGRYMAFFRLRVQAPRELRDVGYLDVYTGEGTELATRRVLSPSEWPETYAYRLVEIPFEVTHPQPMQVRGFFEGEKRATVSHDFVLIQKEGLGESIRVEAEDFFSKVGRVSRDDEATQGICLKIGEAPRGEPVLEETFVFLRAGRYEISCAARGEGETIAVLRLRRVGASSHWRNFEVHGGWEEKGFRVSEASLNLATGGVYGVSLWTAAQAPTAVDYIAFSVASAP